MIPSNYIKLGWPPGTVGANRLPINEDYTAVVMNR